MARQLTVCALSGMDSKAVEEALAGVLDESSNVKADKLERTAKEKAVEHLVRTFDNSKQDDRLRIIDALKYIGSDGASEALVTFLQSENEDILCHAALALSKINDARAQKALKAKLDEKNFPVITSIYEYYIRKGINGSESMLITALAKYGNVAMADVYLNCGNVELEGAAKGWAHSHGYDMIKLEQVLPI